MKLTPLLSLSAAALLFSATVLANDVYTAKVIGIADGDTLTVLRDYTPVRIRLSAIDAPEKAQAYGKQAKLILSGLCFGAEATISPVDTDRYGRTVADVYCNNKNAGETMVKMGYAWVYDQYASMHQAYYPLQTVARANHFGLWADSQAVQPWVWRKQSKELRQ